MGFSRRVKGAGRAKWIAVFALLLFVSSAVPVFAASPAEGAASESSSTTNESSVRPPDSEGIAKALSEVERENTEREKALEAPAAVHEREASAFAFAGVSAQKAEQLLSAKFSEQLAKLNGDPARFLTDATLDQPLGEFGARVTDSKGKTELLESSVPVRTEDEAGQLKKVDLELKSSTEGYEPQNPLVGLRIGKSAGEGVEVGDHGLTITQVNSKASSSGRSFGDKNLFYPEVATDTDQLVSATSSGVELFDMLRSAESPETLRFHLDLPVGSELRSDGNGGAEIAKGQATLAEIPQPRALDGQGAHVPVELEVEGNAIVVNVPRAENQFAYPILVDPEFITDSFSWSSGNNLEALEEWRGIWHWSSNDESQFRHSTYCIYSCFEGVARGLYVSTINANYGAGAYGEWWYYVPGETTYIPSIYPTASATISPFNRNNHGCSWEKYHAPNDYDGSFNAAGEWQWFETDRAQWYGYATMYTKAKGIALGMGSGGGVNIPCWRDVRGGGVSVALADSEAPTINWVNGIPGGWAKDFTITAQASDPGLGVDGITLSPTGAGPNTIGSCSGLYAELCPSSREASWDSGYFAEGEHNASITSYDPLGATPESDPNHVSSSYGFKTRFDQGKPEVKLEGQLTEAIQEAKTEGEVNKQGAAQLRLPVYNLKIEATDKASNGNPQTEEAARRSGMKNIRVFVDGKEKKVPWSAQECPGPAFSCPMPETYPLYMNELEGGGTHELEVVAEDQVGNERAEKIKFEYFPATGMKEEYVLQHFPLADGKDHSEEQEYGGPELAVNVMNGNLVFHQKDVEVKGPAVDLEVERFYNSEFPKEDNTEWGAGWTLAQAPKLEPEEVKEGEAPRKATALRATSALESSVGLPTESGGTQFDKKLQAVVTKKAGGGYTVADQSGETEDTLAFDNAGKVTEMRTPGYARVDYSYNHGNLSEIAVKDPAHFGGVLPPEPEGSPEAPAFGFAFGGAGSGPGQLSSPSGVATDSEGNVWVADTKHNRIQEFNAKGEFIRQFGGKGSGGGQLYEPKGIAVNSEGNLWVADTGNNRIEKFTPAGELLSQFGTKGSGNGQFLGPQGIALDAGGNVWVADPGNYRIQEFNAKGEFIRKFGASGSGNGQLAAPYGVAVDSKGNVWVADTGNNRIQEFTSTGGFIRKFGTLGSEAGQLKSPTGIAIDPEGKVWVADTSNSRIEEFNAEGKYLSQLGTAGDNRGQFFEPHGIAADSKGNIWVADTKNNRIQESTAGEFIRQFGGEGSEGGHLSLPAAVVTDTEGNVWVADSEHNRIQEFNSKGEFVRQFGSQGTGNGQFSWPQGIATDSEGNVWVADTLNHRIQEFNAKGEFIRKFGSQGSENGQLYWPEGIAADSAGNVWVADSGNHRIQEFNAKGEFVRKFAAGSEPKGIALDSKGNLWVADTANNDIEELSPEGELVQQFGTKGSEAGQLKSPTGLSLDAEGTVWVGDTGNDRIEEFNAKGEYLSQFGAPGNDSGQLAEPKGIALDSKGNLWVADTANNRVQEFAASEFVRKFGGAGSEAGQLSSPNGVASDSEGDVWVADTSHNRVQEFNSKGEFIRQFGAKGSANGEFSSPRGIAVDPEDHVWVADSGNSRIQEFNAKGEFIRKFGAKGNEDGKFSYLQGVAVDPDGHVWTVETKLLLKEEPTRVQEFTATGEFIRGFGSEGTEDGQFKSPAGIAADAEGNVWVADTGNKRIQEFKSNGELIRKFGSEGSGNGQFSSPAAVAFDVEGDVWVTDKGNNRVEEFNPEGEYRNQFGTVGDNEGQLFEPRGIAVSLNGQIWIADTGNNQVGQWQIPSYVPKHSSIYDSSFGAEGTAGGQLKHPADVVVDPEGDLWLADKANNRVEEFNGAGEFIETFGKNVNKTKVEKGGSEAEKDLCTAASEDACQAGEGGAANGQLSRPAALAIDAAGDIWVADKGNHRVEEFSAAGKYLSKFGSQGVANGQLSEAEGIAIDPHGNVWVADTYNGRVQKFNAAGEFLKIVGSPGSGEGQMGEPTGIDIGPGGKVWIADWRDNRVEEFNEAGEFVRQFGTEGTENGQFKHPDGLAIDSRGELWVADEGNDRVQAFTEKGEYVAQFGSKGSGSGQFNFGWPIGLATDSKGNLWVADSNNNRVQHWGVFNVVPANEATVTEKNPEVKVSVASGLVDSVEGEEAGQTSYSHQGELLTAVDGPVGETKYQYDSEERLTKVTLPNGTWGEVKYDAYGRVESVTVSVEGAKAKTTNFTYKDEPRRTTVSPEGEPATVYDIGPDGSVLKWWNTQVPPELENLSGSLYANKETSQAITPGDYNLLVQAYSVEGIASIEIVANGNQLVDEKTCTQTPETNCKTVEDPWVTNTGDWPPGILNLDVIVTDSVGNTESAKFWVNIPYTPPPDPEAPEPPKFEEVLRFREEFGLDLDLKGNQLAIDERIFNLIGNWYNPHTPAGEVARATDEKWGVPLRATDAAELEYREAYLAQAATAIPAWAEAHAASSYAGYYVDQARGGLILVGFTENQETLVEQLKASGVLMAPSRLVAFDTQPKYSLTTLASTSHEFSVGLASRPDIGVVMTGKGTDVPGNQIKVDTSSVSAVQSYIAEHFNAALFTVEYQGQRPAHERSADHFPPQRVRGADDRLFAGDALSGQGDSGLGLCTMNFGAIENTGRQKPNGQYIWTPFALEAGHCFEQGATVYRYAREHGEYVEFPIGKVARRAYNVPTEGYATDVEAIHLEYGFRPAQWIWVSRGYAQKTVAPAVPYAGEIACNSGIEGGNACGTVTGLKEVYFEKAIYPEWVWEIAGLHTIPGDSGGPVWDLRTGAALGNWTGGHIFFTPILGSPAEEGGVVVGHSVGMLAAPQMGNLQIKAVP